MTITNFVVNLPTPLKDYGNVTSMEFALILIPFLLAAVIPVFGPRIRETQLNWVLAAVMLALFGWLLTLFPTIYTQDSIRIEQMWVESFGLTFALYIDGLALLFALLITGIGAAVFLYAGYYMEGDPRAPRFFALLMAFAGSMLGVVLSGNLILLFICWELTSIFSFLLIGFDGTKPEARTGAAQALVITGGGGLALFVGIVLMGLAGGSFDLAQILQTPLQDHPHYTAITLLVLLGCFTKSAQVPFHFWLPGGMTAPTPASAYLHSATMVKAGIYLLARLYPTLGDTDLWLIALVSVGAVTMLVGAFNAPFKRDLKALLAYATVSWLGALVMLLGLPHYEGYMAAMVGIIGHALYKSPLFMLAGAIDHATGTRDISKLGGLARTMPIGALIAVVSGLSMAGIIPLMGFVSKETLIHALLAYHGELATLIAVVAFVAAGFLVVAVAIYVWDVFFRPAHSDAVLSPVHDENAAAHDHHHPLNPLIFLGPGVIALMSLLTALLLEPLIKPLVELAVPVDFSLYLFGGFNLEFMISLLIVAAGLAVFLVRGRWLRPLPERFSLARGYKGFMQGLDRIGDALLRVQSGKLSHYLAVILGVVGILMVLPGAQYLQTVGIQFELQGATDILKGVMLILSLVATLASILFKGHLLAALALGVSGYAVAGVFLLEPATDVALVTVLVETLAAVLIIVMLSRISEKKRRRAADVLWGSGRRILRRDVIVALMVSAGVTAFALSAVINRPERQSIIADWYLANTEMVGVTDVVGAMITDFRATDTMIEITVFSMAALGALTVLQLTKRRDMDGAFQLPIPVSQITTPLTRLAATLFLPFTVIIALSQLLYSGYAPGDGFTAGVVGGISLALWYQVFGYGVQRLRNIRADRIIGVGLSLALINGMLPLLLGSDFLAHNKFGDIPLPAGLHFSSSTLFEIAIALTVFGSMVNILNAITNPEGIEQL
jgi:multicomponent K+:H+ antiporter subunit A